jgi:DNA repair exonuclease SbcCD ATPase subunit
MLKRLKVTNFGKHRDREIFFTDGLNTVVGPNEAGKSTIAIEAVGYAFFGTALLRETVDDTVTKGEKVGSMKVELDYGDYQIVRSKSSAAVTGPNGLKISGQAEVSQFFYDLFGIAKGSERSIAIAEQGDIQGILSSRGNAKAVEFIESVAGLSQLDVLVEKVKARYPSGSRAALESIIEQDSVALANEKAVMVPDVTMIHNELKVKEEVFQKILSSEREHNEALREAEKQMSALRTAQVGLDNNRRREAELLGKKDEEEEAIGGLVLNLDQIKIEVELLAAARERNERLIRDAHAARSIATAKEKIDSLKVKENTEVWEGTLEEMIAESVRLHSERKTLQVLRAEAAMSLRNAEVTIGQNPVCPICGTDLSERQEEMKRLAADHADALRKSIQEFDEVLKENEEVSAALRQINEEHQRILNTVSSIKTLLDTPDKYIAVANPGEIPELYHWVGDVPTAATVEEVVAAREELKQLQSLEVKQGRIETEITQRTRAVSSVQDELQRVREALTELEKIDLSKIPLVEGRIRLCETALADYADRRQVAQDDITALSNKLNQAKQEVNRHEEAIKRYTANIETAKKKIEEDQENAELMKEIKSARTKVINQVWNLLLETTAEYFSTVRGEECVIERTDKSFMVNDEKAGRLSGSTRDALGLAIRAATCEIFAPRVDFLLLDEVAAGMDPERTARAMAMVASLPIDQVILCTHEGVSDTLANNVIEV